MKTTAVRFETPDPNSNRVSLDLLGRECHCAVVERVLEALEATLNEPEAHTWFLARLLKFFLYVDKCRRNSALENMPTSDFLPPQSGRLRKVKNAEKRNRDLLPVID